MTLWQQARAVPVRTWDTEKHEFVDLADAINRAILDHVKPGEAVEIVPALAASENEADRALLIVGIPCTGGAS